jgi:hypothetical protein
MYSMRVRAMYSMIVRAMYSMMVRAMYSMKFYSNLYFQRISISIFKDIYTQRKKLSTPMLF